MIADGTVAPGADGFGGLSMDGDVYLNAIAGTFLFHLLIVVVSLAGQELMDSPQIGEYLREFFAFAIIGATIAIHAWRTRSESH